MNRQVALLHRPTPEISVAVALGVNLLCTLVLLWLGWEVPAALASNESAVKTVHVATLVRALFDPLLLMMTFGLWMGTLGLGRRLLFRRSEVNWSSAAAVLSAEAASRVSLVVGYYLAKQAAGSTQMVLGRQGISSGHGAFISQYLMSVARPENALWCATLATVLVLAKIGPAREIFVLCLAMSMLRPGVYMAVGAFLR